MKNSIYYLSLTLLLMAGCHCGDEKSASESKLIVDASSHLNIDTLYPDTPAGKVIKDHINASMGNGADAEDIYQRSLQVLRKEPGAGEALYATYKKAPQQLYFLRTMLVEALKELRSPDALTYLTNIAQEKIPANLYPENKESDTRENEIIIRVTAVEGISKLAADSNALAERTLYGLLDSEDLTVRQMAARGYLQSAIGNVKEKTEQLKRRLPQSEHWYITTDTTVIRKVPHPDMPKEFKLEQKNTSTPPKIK